MNYSTNNAPRATASASSNGGIGLCGLTFVVLLALKLAGIADISWWWVFSPLLIGFGLTLLVIIVVLVVGLVVALSKK